MRFKVGDIVKIIKNIGSNELDPHINELGRIIKIYEGIDYPYEIVFILKTKKEEILLTSRWKEEELIKANKKEAKLFEHKLIEREI